MGGGFGLVVGDAVGVGVGVTLGVAVGSELSLDEDEGDGLWLGSSSWAVTVSASRLAEVSLGDTCGLAEMDGAGEALESRISSAAACGLMPRKRAKARAMPTNLAGVGRFFMGSPRALV